MTLVPAVHPWLAATPWPAEDGGPRRLQQAHGIAGPNARSATVTAVRHEPVCVMAVHAPGGRVLLLRNTIGGGPDAVSWVEDIDPFDLGVRGRSPDLPLGPYWPGGMAVLADGAVVVVQGRWAHRLSASLTLEQSVPLPVEAPHNSFVVLDDGSLALKDLQPPGGPPSTLSVLDPVTLEARCAPVALPEPSVARLSAHGHQLVVVGVDAVHRLAWDHDAGSLTPVVAPARYRTRPDQSYGWDAVMARDAVWWMDNGDHTFPNGFTMIGNGVAAGPVRLWWWREDDGAIGSVEVSGLPNGAVTNPPLVDDDRGVVVAYDSANGVLAAFDIAALDGQGTVTPRWRLPMHTAQHLVLYPDTGELLANHHDRTAGDSLVVVDIATGEERCRAVVGSPAQSVVFCTPGLHRDALYVSLSTVARVTFHDEESAVTPG